MGKNVVRAIFFATTLLVGGVSVVAQETASIPTAISMQPTVALCEQGQGAEGTCLAPTGAYLNRLVAQSLPATDFSQELTNFVLLLAAIAQADAECTEVDNEIAEAIRLAATYALDAEQRASLLEIGNTIGACADFATAAITPVSPN